MMRKIRTPETEEQRSERLELEAQRRNVDAAVEDQSLDAMIKKSIELHGP
jgi:hypothetical protein